ncbi:MAG: M15 family metallopeptidase [Rickettsiaceae bacterium H1]|nr:M15 family metallopeptidase [Rickettsiaceae bacterium H1]
MQKILINLIFFLFCASSLSHAQNPTFKSEPLPKDVKQKLMQQKQWAKGCPVSLDRLSLLTLSYYDFTKKEHYDGKMIVLDAVAESVINIFKHLFDQSFPIGNIYPYKDGEGNLTSSFFCRSITEGAKPSIHSYGLAIDVNITQNPYLNAGNPNEILMIPPEGKDFLNRSNQRPGMIESIVDLFAKNGFPIWGGNWNTPIDWQHLQTSRSAAEILVVLSSINAKEFFAKYYVNYNNFIDKMLSDKPDVLEKIKKYYTTHPYEDLNYLLNCLSLGNYC